jgi:TRAP-type C4-dicarboxylate transport system permease small subunit
VAHAYEQLKGLIERITWVLTGALVILVSANVFARYVLGIGILWAEELSRLCFVWMVFLGAYVALTRKSHMAIVMAIKRLPPAYQTVLLSATRALVLVFLLCLTYAGVDLVLATVRFGRITPMMEISSAWGYVAVPVAGALMAIEMLRQLLLAEPLPPDEAELVVAESQDPV